MPLSPLMPEVDEKLNKFYMPFKMEIVDTKSTTTQVVDSYKSIFYDGDTSHTNIYIQGEAGIGKSTCCTKVALIWSESISKEIARNDCSINTSTVDPMQNEESIFSDEAIIHKFDFVFSLALRDFEGEWEIERMIEKFIVSELPDPQKYAGLVSTILDKKRCLIILDGLDEWSHQGKVCKNPGLIPHRKSWSNTTVLTLTRPWKMNEVRLRDSEISVLIQITGITDSEKFLRNVLNCLNDKYNTTHDLKGFLETIKVEKMEHFFEIPVLAMQVLWLWHSGYQLGDSKCKIYMNMLDMLFGRAQEMLFGIAQEKFGMFSDENDTPQTGLPSCFESTTYCEQHKLLLDCLGSLAFHTLHSCKREESLIFSESIVKKHMNSNAAVKTARTTGILSQHKSSSRIARCSHFSFLHKTFQEFLAAYYVATHVDESENTMQTLAKVYGQTVDIMDISELFTFVCGLSTEMSSKISESVMQSFSVKLTNHVEGLHIYGGYYEVACMTKSLQDMILAGYKESICNGHQDPQLALNHVFYSSGRNSSDDDVKYRDRLVDRNIDKIEALCAEHCTVNTVKIQQILTQSSSTLSHVGLQNIKGLNDAYLDLSTNISLKSLYLSDIKTDFDIKLNTSSLLYCHLWELNEKVEHNTLSALTAALQLRTLKAGYCKNMSIVCQVLHTLPLLHRLDVHVNCGIIPVSLCQTLSTLPQIRRLTLLADCEDRSLLCRTLPTLSNLQYIQLCHTDLGDNDILLPSSIKMIELDTLTLTGRSWRQLVDKLTQMPHQVKCILWHCSITVSHEEEKKKEWDNIVKYIQQYNMFEIRRNNIDDIGRISLHFSTCTSDKY